MDAPSLDTTTPAPVPPAPDAGAAPAEAVQPRGAHWTPERIAQLKELWSQGLSLNEIARTIGQLTRNQVVGKVHRLGLPGRPSPLVAPASAWYRKARAEAPSAAEPFPVAELLGLPGARLLLGLPPLAPPPESRPSPQPESRPSTRSLESLFDGARGVSAAIQGLRAGACKWPIGDPKDPDFHFCCKPRKGKAYCDEHARLAYDDSKGRIRVPRAA